MESEYSIEWALRPIHLSMTIVGLHFPLKKTEIVKSIFLCTYFCFITFTNLYDLFRYFQTYKHAMAFGPTLVMKICVHVFYVSVIMGSLSQFRYSVAKENILTAWQEYVNTYKIKRSVVMAFRRKCIMFTCFGWFMTIVCLLATSYELSHDDSITEDLFAYVSMLNAPWKVALFLIHYFYSAAVLSFSVYHLVTLCSGLGQEFNEIHADLKRKMDPEGGLKIGLEVIRQRHRTLSEVVAQVDGIFSVYVLFSVVVNTGMCCLVMYSLFTARTDSPSKYMSIAILFLFYMAIFLIIPLSISFSGVHLHQAYSTFLDHLRDGRVGITGWRFFLVTKMTVKTIFIMLISYTAVLLRFGNNEYKSDLFGLNATTTMASVQTHTPSPVVFATPPNGP